MFCVFRFSLISQKKKHSLSLSTTMANNYMQCFLGAMDRLWFHQIILLSQPTNSLISNQNHESISPPHQHHVSDSFTSPSSSLFLPTLDDDDDDDARDQQNSSESPPNTTLQDDSNYEEDEDEDDDHDHEDEENYSQKQQKARRNMLATKLNRSNSSSPSSSSAEKLNISKKSTRRSLALQKSMSCRSFGELELEELKGFMDLGFSFKKENMSPRMMSLLPGLQRLGGVPNHKNKVSKAAAHEVEESKSRPYLSEAWLINKPNSPLLNLRIPKLSAASEMKKHLRFWARTVASEIQ